MPDTTHPSRRLAGNPAEVYEQHFVPAIGEPCARELLGVARLSPGDRVVDVACGTGVAARMAAAAVAPDGTVTGIDGHPGMLDVARATDETIDWREAPAEALPLDDTSFDAALCSLGLQFFGDRSAALAEMRRVLVAEGRVAVGVPGPTPPVFEALHDVVDRHLGADWAGFVHAVFDLHDPGEIEGLLTGAGYADVEVTIRPLSLRLPPPQEFLWHYLLGTPLAMAAAELDDARRADIERDAVANWQPFTTAGGLQLDVDLVLATGRAAA